METERERQKDGNEEVMANDNGTEASGLLIETKINAGRARVPILQVGYSRVMNSSRFISTRETAIQAAASGAAMS